MFLLMVLNCNAINYKTSLKITDKKQEIKVKNTFRDSLPFIYSNTTSYVRQIVCFVKLIKTLKGKPKHFP